MLGEDTRRTGRMDTVSTRVVVDVVEVEVGVEEVGVEVVGTLGGLAGTRPGGVVGRWAGEEGAA